MRDTLPLPVVTQDLTPPYVLHFALLAMQEGVSLSFLGQRAWLNFCLSVT